MPTPSTSPEMDCWRERRLLEVGQYCDLATLAWSDLQRIEIFPGVALGDPILSVPEEYLPPGVMRRPASRRRDPLLGGRLCAGVNQDVALQREENVRRALLVLWLPHEGKRGSNGLGPSSWLTHSALFLRAVSRVIDDAPPDLGNIWLLFHDDRYAKFRMITKCDRSRRDLETIYQRLKRASERGLVPDFLKTESQSDGPDRTLEQSHKRPKENRNPSDRRTGSAKAPTKKHFDDEFVVETIGRAVWVLDNIADKCIECWSATEEVRRAEPTLSYDQLKARKNAIIRQFDWSGLDGTVCSNLPFMVRQRTDHQRYSLTDNWPPKNHGTLTLLIGVIQALNFTLLAFCTAARHHEISGTLEDSEE